MHPIGKKTHRPARRGAIIVLAAFCIIIAAAFLAFAIDYGYIVVTESELQNAADSGALSGARALSGGRDAAIAAAKDWTAKNIAAGEAVALLTSEDVELGLWDKDTATFTPLPEDSEESPNAVRVTCRRTSARENSLKLFFAPIIGISEADLTVVAIAVSGGSCGGIMALNRVYLREDSYTDSYDSSNGAYGGGNVGKNGDVCTNGHIRLLHNAGINGDAHPGPEEDGVDMRDTNYVTGDIEVLKDYIDFPAVDLGDVAVSNDNSKIPQTTNGLDALKDGTLELGEDSTTKKNKKKKGGGNGDGDSGRGNGDPDSVNLPPGTYYFSGLNLYNNSIINITGPTLIYINGDADLTAGGIVNHTGIPINLQIYPLGGKFDLPNDVDLHAVIYSTTSAIEKAGGAGGFFGKMVGQKIKINGSGGLHVDESLNFGDLRSGAEQLGSANGVKLVY